MEKNENISNLSNIVILLQKIYTKCKANPIYLLLQIAILSMALKSFRSKGEMKFR